MKKTLSGGTTQSISTASKLTASDVREAVKLIRKHRIKPRWRFIREFPFIQQVYYGFPRKIQDTTS